MAVHVCHVNVVGIRAAQFAVHPEAKENGKARLHMRHLRASLRARLAILAAPPILPLVGPPIVCTPIALALALFFVFQPLLPPRGLRLQPIELAVETVAMRGQGGRVAAPGPK